MYMSCIFVESWNYLLMSRAPKDETKKTIRWSFFPAMPQEQLPERLSTGAVVEELQLVGERLQYQLRSGEGPKTGWVSISLKDKAWCGRG